MVSISVANMVREVFFFFFEFFSIFCHCPIGQHWTIAYNANCIRDNFFFYSDILLYALPRAYRPRSEVRPRSRAVLETITNFLSKFELLILLRILIHLCYIPYQALTFAHVRKHVQTHAPFHSFAQGASTVLDTHYI